MDGANGPIPVICGPTGTGKTAVALALAELERIEIISADSRQVYTGLDIGTAKPTAAERERVPHHGLDLIPPSARYSAAAFAADAARWIGEIRGRGALPVVVGGTGLYLRALFEGLFEEPHQPPDVRARLRDTLSRFDVAELQRWAGRLDPGFRGDGGAHRAQRAVEVALLAGRPLSALQREQRLQPDVRPWYAVMTLPREQLAARIRVRVRAMIDGGLVDETRAVLAAGIQPDAPGLSGVGYQEAAAHLRGEWTLELMEDAIVIATRQYAKRQETWFRHQLGDGLMMLDATKAPDTLAREVLSGYRASLMADRVET